MCENLKLVIKEIEISLHNEKGTARFYSTEKQEDLPRLFASKETYILKNGRLTTYVHLFDSCTQDFHLRKLNLLLTLKAHNPFIHSVRSPKIRRSGVLPQQLVVSKYT